MKLEIGKDYTFTYRGHKLVYKVVARYLGECNWADCVWDRWFVYELDHEVPYGKNDYLDIVEGRKE